jgi:DNA-binding NarL/FixJ family response regulator
MRTIRLFLVDDEQHVRRGLRMRLEMERDFEVVGEAGDACAAIAGVLDTRPDVVLMDIAMPGKDGVAIIADLRAVSACSVVMVSMQDDPVTRARAMAAGAAGFVGKHEIDTALTRAIRSAGNRRRDGGAAEGYGPHRAADEMEEMR